MKVGEYLADAKTRFRPVDADDVAFSIQNARRYREYNDLLVLSTARRLGCPLLTFDKRLSARAGEFDVGLVLQAQAHNAGSSSKSHPAGA